MSDRSEKPMGRPCSYCKAPVWNARVGETGQLRVVLVNAEPVGILGAPGVAGDDLMIADGPLSTWPSPKVRMANPLFDHGQEVYRGHSCKRHSWRSAFGSPSDA